MEELVLQIVSNFTSPLRRTWENYSNHQGQLVDSKCRHQELDRPLKDQKRLSNVFKVKGFAWTLQNDTEKEWPLWSDD